MKFFFALILLSSSAMALEGEKEKVLRDHNITLVNDVEDKYIDEFLVELEKFPKNLFSEMLKKNARIDLLQGVGVTEHPMWKSDKPTWDERAWNTIPGSGGIPSSNIQTIIVVNSLKKGHGSVNLFLHEHGHALDNTYDYEAVSRSSEWQDLMSVESVRSFLVKNCGEYCLHPREGFAELFAQFYHSHESKKKLELEAPEAFKYFENLKSIKKALN